MNKAAIDALDAQVRRNWSYRADAPGVANNLWRSFADDVLAGKAWQGDCSDLVATFNDLASRQGVALDRLYRVIVVSGVDGAKPDHQIAAVEDDDGAMWVAADTFFPWPYPPHSIQHKPHCYNRLSEAGDNPIWRDGFPWS